MARYVLGLVIFTTLRHLADDLGLAPWVRYLIEGERALFGEVPTGTGGHLNHEEPRVVYSVTIMQVDVFAVTALAGVAWS